jgi:6-phosphogluconolactonase (cycloisomerase 2 family)
MRQRHPTLGTRIIVTGVAIVSGIASAVAAGVVATPASGVTNLYAPQVTSTTGGELSQFAVTPDGSLTALEPAAALPPPVDIAVTPDGRFAYVAVSQQTNGIVTFARGAGGRMQPASSVDGVAFPTAVLVDPQGARVFYGTSGGALESRAIDPASGDLGAAAPIALDAGTPRSLAMTPTGTSLYVGVSDGESVARIFQFDVDPATGAATPKAQASVSWPFVPTAVRQQAATSIARLAVSPDGGHLYAASGNGDTGLAHFAIDATGALGPGSIVGAPVAPDVSATSVAAISPDGLFLWAPTSGGAEPSGRIDRFEIGAAGALSPLAPPAPYLATAAAATRDAVAAPNGRALYLGQDGNVGHWTVGPGATLTGPANFPILLGDRNAGLALSPSQAPVASLTAAAQPAGQATTFDAGASTDPDGSVARYDWDFGDGATLPAGGPAPSHVYATPGARTVTVTVTDADGTSTAKLWTGARMLRNGGPSARTTLAVTVPAQSATPPSPPGPGPRRRPRPDRGKSATINALRGSVRVKVPGANRYVILKLLREIPLGSTVDARKGRVRVTGEVDQRTHKQQAATFYEGIFKITQTKGRKPILVATLAGGTFKGCARGRSRIAITRAVPRSARAGRVELVAKRAKHSKRKVRRLWGRGEGDFRTTGRRSSATVRGTWWLVEDRCDGTYTRVRQGRVDVRDFRLRKTIKLRSGKRSMYLAKAP